MCFPEWENVSKLLTGTVHPNILFLTCFLLEFGVLLVVLCPLPVYFLFTSCPKQEGMVVALKSLPPGTMLNIVGFGTSIKALFSTSKLCTDVSSLSAYPLTLAVPCAPHCAALSLPSICILMVKACDSRSLASSYLFSTQPQEWRLVSRLF